MSNSPRSHTEIIIFCSGKGGTGKTSLISALGYALGRSGHAVLLMDADRATDGLSLFMLGPEGREQLASFTPESTFNGIIAAHVEGRGAPPQPHRIDRLGTQDHELSYDAIISDRFLYGDYDSAGNIAAASIDRPYERGAFQRAVQALFKDIRDSGRYDYVLVDTRGGFSFESTDIAAAGDSFIVVTEATYTNFYQDRNLVDRISQAAVQMGTRSLLRAIMINKSTDPLETAFRNELVREFGLRFEDTFPISLDVDAMRAYKMQKAVFREAPASRFAFDALQAFQRILRIVTSQWPVERVEKWNQLVSAVEGAIALHNAEVEREAKQRAEHLERFALLESDQARLTAELERERLARQQERERQDILVQELRSQEASRDRRNEEDRARERAVAEARMEALAAQHAAEIRSRQADAFVRNILRMLAASAVAALATWFVIWKGSTPAPTVAAAIDPYASASSPVPVPVPVPAPAAAASAAEPPPELAQAQQQQQQQAQQQLPAKLGSSNNSHNNTAGIAAPASWLRPCVEGTKNVIVASGFADAQDAAATQASLERRYPDFSFEAVYTASSAQARQMNRAILAGRGLSLAQAQELLKLLQAARVSNEALITTQYWDCRDSTPALYTSGPGPVAKKY